MRPRHCQTWPACLLSRPLWCRLGRCRRRPWRSTRPRRGCRPAARWSPGCSSGTSCPSRWTPAHCWSVGLFLGYFFRFVFRISTSQLLALLTWQTYFPWSRWLTNLMARVQSLPPGVWRTVNLSSWVKVLGPVLRMCQSRSRIQDTCGETVSNVSILEGLYPLDCIQ